MSRTTRWAVLVGILTLALVVALLPLLLQIDKTPEEEDNEHDADVQQARAEAALQDCPEPGERSVAELEDVEATCLADGSSVDLGAALGEGPALINFWATWCEPCREELPLLETYANEPDSVPVLTVQVESDLVDGLEMLEELDVHLPGVHEGTDGPGPVRTALHVPRALPASYLVHDGSVDLIEEPRVFTSLEHIHHAVEHG